MEVDPGRLMLRDSSVTQQRSRYTNLLAYLNPFHVDIDESMRLLVGRCETRTPTYYGGCRSNPSNIFLTPSAGKSEQERVATVCYRVLWHTHASVFTRTLGRTVPYCLSAMVSWSCGINGVCLIWGICTCRTLNRFKPYVMQGKKCSVGGWGVGFYQFMFH